MNGWIVEWLNGWIGEVMLEWVAERKESAVSKEFKERSRA
jgi:hypothetical protein